jgi:uncharacterized protein (TIGR03067 family)
VRSAIGNELKIRYGGMIAIHALVRYDESHDPIHVDYYSLEAPTKGTIRYGIFKWVGDEASVCMARTGEPRPTEFNAPAGSHLTLSQWRRKK